LSPRFSHNFHAIEEALAAMGVGRLANDRDDEHGVRVDLNSVE
jgi:hypothetical protein